MYINKVTQTSKATSYFSLITTARQLPDNVIHGGNTETKKIRFQDLGLFVPMKFITNYLQVTEKNGKLFSG